MIPYWIGYVLAFNAGQWLFLLKRMALAVRSPMNALRSRRQYLAQNWDILIYRGVIEFGFLWAYLHQEQLGQLLALVHVFLSFRIPVFGFGCFALGLLCDFTMDWIAMQDRVLGIPVPSWIKEFVPRLPQLEIVVANLQISAKGDIPPPHDVQA
jgi:hypothetical protein